MPNEGQEPTFWYILAGALFLMMALAGSFVKRMPLTTSMLYLGIGAGIGPHGLGLVQFDTAGRSTFLERITELTVIISLFTAGLKLRMPIRDPRWRPAIRLALASMTLTVMLIAVISVYLLDLPWGAGILLGAVLAPTDPVLASDVQMEHPFRYDRLRFTLTGEAEFNDGTAFPFVMLGLGMLGLHDLGPGGSRWFTMDVLWAVLGGLAIGALLGTLVSQLVLYLRRKHKEAVGLDDFLALGLITLSYGLALLCHTYGFLAVAAAGLALRQTEQAFSGEEPPSGIHATTDAAETEEIATSHEAGPAYMAQAVLSFNEHLERIAELGVVLIVGVLLGPTFFSPEALWFIPLLFLVVRPLSVAGGLMGSEVPARERLLISWFGIRGIGSIYYLMYAITHGLPDAIAGKLLALTLPTVVASIVLHGMSVTPLMRVQAKARAAES